MNAARNAANCKTPADDRSQYVALVAHELRGPLMPILNAAAILKHRPLDLEVVEHCAAIIDRQARIISRRVDDLMDVSRVQMGGFALQRKRISIADVVRQAVEMVAPLAKQRGLSLAVSLRTEPIEVDGDEERLVQALQNLLSNAVKFNNGGNDIHVRARRENEDAVVTVTDSGIGLEAAEIESVFALFAQCEPAVSAHPIAGSASGSISRAPSRKPMAGASRPRAPAEGKAVPSRCASPRSRQIPTMRTAFNASQTNGRSLS